VSYKLVVTDLVRKLVSGWGLPDTVLVEIYLRLRDGLTERPAATLIRAEVPFDGMMFKFEMIDPHNRLNTYRAFFQVLYGQDEETLYIVHATVQHTIGP
jgi:hypothetical protein